MKLPCTSQICLPLLFTLFSTLTQIASPFEQVPQENVGLKETDGLHGGEDQLDEWSEGVEAVEKELIILWDDNFEHYTQASTGATTGDWLVLFCNMEKRSKSCSELKKQFMHIAKRKDGLMNVAMIVYSEISKLTFRRFGLPEFTPEIMFFRLGYQWVYAGPKTEDAIMAFVSGGFSDQPKQKVEKKLEFFEVWWGDLKIELAACWKEKRMPNKSTYMAISTVAVGVFIIFVFFWPRSVEEEEDEQVKGGSKKESKRKN